MVSFVLIKADPKVSMKINDFRSFFNSKSFCQLRNEFHFSGVHGAMNRSGSRAK